MTSTSQKQLNQGEMLLKMRNEKVNALAANIKLLEGSPNPLVSCCKNECNPRHSFCPPSQENITGWNKLLSKWGHTYKDYMENIHKKFTHMSNIQR